MIGRDHFGSRQGTLLGDLLQRNLSQIFAEEEKAPELGSERARGEIQQSDISDASSFGLGRMRTFVISTPRQASKAFFLEKLGDGDGAETGLLLRECTLDIVHREVLLAQLDDTVADTVTLGCDTWSLVRGKKELAIRVAAEVMAEDAKGTRRVAEARRGFGRRDPIDEEGAQGLILAMCGGGWVEESAGK